MCLARLSASEYEIHPLGGLLAGRLRSWETSVSGSDSPEPSLAPFELTCSSFLDSLYRMFGVLASEGAIPHNFPWHLDHLTATQLLVRREPPMTRI